VDTDTTNGPSRFFDPQTEYDANSGRLWMVYSEENVTGGLGTGSVANLHLAVSRDPAVLPGSVGLTDFGTSQWWFYTGTSANPGNGGVSIDMRDTAMKPYRDGAHEPFPPDAGIVDKPHMAVDEQAVYIATCAGASPGSGQIGGTLLIVPKEHDAGAKSILDGERPAAGDMTFLRFRDLPASDDHENHYAVHEPRSNIGSGNAQFFISSPFSSDTKDDTIRLGGLWFDENADPDEEWVYRQRIDSTGALDDMPVDPGFEFFGTSTHAPLTPDDADECGSGRSTDWTVATTSAWFASAVLAADVNNNPRIFAVHHVLPVGGAAPSFAPEDRKVVQWYVIDPDLDNFRATGDGWDPQIIQTGRIDPGTGDSYHPVIAVTPQGVAYIEYTHSGTTTWPQIRRARLSNDYASVVSDTLVQAGPATAYIADDFSSTNNGGWADFADMQADPDDCGLWSVHTLVSQTDLPVCQVNARSVWLFENSGNCNNANLNGDDSVDVYDMALFSDYYDAGARRVDMNTDGTTDAADAAQYADAYDDQRP